MLSSGIDDIGGVQWELLLLLGVSWILIYVILGKGLSQSGKVECVARSAGAATAFFWSLARTVYRGRPVGRSFFSFQKSSYRRGNIRRYGSAFIELRLFHALRWYLNVHNSEQHTDELKNVYFVLSRSRFWTLLIFYIIFKIKISVFDWYVCDM